MINLIYILFFIGHIISHRQVKIQPKASIFQIKKIKIFNTLHYKISQNKYFIFLKSYHDKSPKFFKFLIIFNLIILIYITKNYYVTYRNNQEYRKFFIGNII